MNKLNKLIKYYNNAPNTHTITKIIKTIENDWNIKLTDIEQLCDTCMKYERIDLLILLTTYYPNHVKTNNQKQYAIEILQNHIDKLYNFVCVKYKEHYRNIHELNQFVNYVPFNPWRTITDIFPQNTYEQYIQIIKHMINDKKVLIKLNDTEYVMNKSSCLVIMSVQKSCYKHQIYHMINTIYNIIINNKIKKVVFIQHDTDKTLKKQHIIKQEVDNYNIDQLCEVTYTYINCTNGNSQLSGNIEQIIEKLITINPEVILFDDVINTPINFYLSQYKLANIQIGIGNSNTNYGIGTLTHIVVPNCIHHMYTTNEIHKKIQSIRKQQPIYDMTCNKEINIKRIGFTTPYYQLAPDDQYYKMIVDLLNRLDENHILYKIVLVSDEQINDTLFNKLIGGGLKIKQLRYFEVYHADCSQTFTQLFNILLTCDVLIDNTKINNSNMIVNELLMYGKLIFTYGNRDMINQVLRNINCDYLIHPTFTEMNINVVKLLKYDKINVILHSYVYCLLTTHDIDSIYNYQLWELHNTIDLYFQDLIQPKCVIYSNDSENGVYDILIRLICMKYGIKFCQNVNDINDYVFKMMGFDEHTIFVIISSTKNDEIQRFNTKYNKVCYVVINDTLNITNFEKCEREEKQKKHIKWDV